MSAVARAPFSLAALLVLSFAGCSKSTTAAAPTTALFDPNADFTQPASYFAFPSPSDLRLSANGTPDYAGLASPPGITLLDNMKRIAADHPGFTTVPVAYFRFSAPIAPRVEDDVIAADKTSPILLVDVDDASPERGKLIPTVAATPDVDAYIPDNLLTVAARPGFVLAPSRKYAFVVTRSLGDSTGAKLGVPDALAKLAAGQAPDGARGAAASALYAPLFKTLRDAVGLDAGEVAAATVFTTGDVVASLNDLSSKLLAKYSVTIDNLKIAPGGDQQARFCELVGTVTYPQFQQGTPPFDSQGLFSFTDGGLPAKQRDEVAPIALTLPKGTGAMPVDGYPLVVYFHGSGGISTQFVDRGPVKTPGGPETPFQGPAYVLAPHGFAMAGSALPVNPERLPGATDTAYLNFANLAAMRDTFRQGVIEQRLFFEALKKLQIPPSAVASCTGLSLPAGSTAYKFAADPLLAMGQSMGGMYTNMVSAVEPRIKAAVPTGAGGFWTYFILKTSLIDNLPGKLDLLLGVNVTEKLSFMHPVLSMIETGWETIDPFIFMPRLAKRPLPTHPVRPIYEPVGKGDSYFPTVLYDAVALSYGHKQAGTEVWPTMQPGLKLAGLDGVLPYPVTQDVSSLAGNAPYTGVVVQYEGDGIYDPHAIFAQLDAVKFQYACFLESFLKKGVATVYAPQALDAPCP